ncbi:MAG: hypothetical protein ABIH39_04005 [Candidatus Margulisiibacteriota bacterium]
MLDRLKDAFSGDLSSGAGKSVADGLQNALQGFGSKNNSISAEPVKENTVIAQNEDPAKSALKKTIDNLGIQADSVC